MLNRKGLKMDLGELQISFCTLGCVNNNQRSPFARLKCWHLFCLKTMYKFTFLSVIRIIWTILQHWYWLNTLYHPIYSVWVLGIVRTRQTAAGFLLVFPTDMILASNSIYFKMLNYFFKVWVAQLGQLEINSKVILLVTELVNQWLIQRRW